MRFQKGKIYRLVLRTDSIEEDIGTRQITVLFVQRTGRDTFEGPLLHETKQPYTRVALGYSKNWSHNSYVWELLKESEHPELYNKAAYWRLTGELPKEEEN